MRIIYGLLLALTILASIGCDIDTAARKTMPPEALATSERALELLLARDAEGLRAISTDELRSNASYEDWKNLFDHRGTGEVVDVAIVGFKIASNTATGTTATVTHSVQLEDRNLLVTILLQKSAEKFLLHGLDVKAVAPGSAGVPKLSFANKTAVHYLVLAICAVIPIFIIATLVACLRTKTVKRRIFWCVFILFGLGNLTYNWTTGEFGVSLLQFQILGIAINIVSDWVFEFGVPLGAILWWAMGRRAAAIEPAQRA